MKTKLTNHLMAALLGVACAAETHAQSTTFTYQGRLDDNGSPANGLYDLGFSLYDAASGGSQHGATLVTNGLPVSNGLFSVTLDFGDQFPGADRWLEVAVRSNNCSCAFKVLAPLQRISSAPYALRSANAASAGSADSVNAANITGTLTAVQLPQDLITNNQTGLTLAGTFSGDGSGLTNIPVGAVGGVPIAFTVKSDQTVGVGGSFVGLGNQSNAFDDTALPVPFDGFFSTVAFSIGQNIAAGVPVSPTVGESVDVLLVRVPQTLAQTYGTPRVTLTSVNSAIAAYGANGTPAPDSSIVPEGTTITLAGVLDSTNKHAAVSSALSIPAVAGDLFSVMLKPVGFSSFIPAVTVVYRAGP
jgi:hypothetical protein